MSVRPLIRNVLLASGAGTLLGVLVGVLSVYQYPASRPGPAPPRTSAPRMRTEAAAAAPIPPPAAQADPLPADSDDVVRRARALASAADVHGLIALREDTQQQAASQQGGDAALSRARVAEIERALVKARALRLALDREEFLKGGEDLQSPGTIGRRIR